MEGAEHMGDILITPPAAEAITVAELRAHLQNPSDADAVLTRLIKAAREFFEESTGLALINQTRKLTLDGWPGVGYGDGLGWWDGVRDGAMLGTAPRFVELPRAPLVSITSVTTYDEASAATVWGAGNYFAHAGERPGRLALNAGAVWPIPTRTAAGIEIVYVAGHGATAADVPSRFQLALLQMASHWYENRELLDYDGPEKVPMQAQRIMAKARIIKI